MPQRSAEEGKKSERLMLPHSFKQLLLDVTNHPNKAINDNVRKIAFSGIFREAADELVLESSLGKNRTKDGAVEMGKLIFVTKDNRVLVQNDVEKGSPTEIQMNIRHLLEGMNQGKRIGCFLHSHAVMDIPPSPQDCRSLLINPTDKLSRSCVAVVTIERTVLIFRTDKTPLLSNEKVESALKAWENEWPDIVVEHGKKLRREHPWMSHETLSAILLKEVQAIVLLKKAKELGLAVFVGIGDSVETLYRTENYRDFSIKVEN